MTTVDQNRTGAPVLTDAASGWPVTTTESRKLLRELRDLLSQPAATR